MLARSRIGLLLALSPLASACATIPESAGGNDGLPNAGAGPFRPITQAELPSNRTAPAVLDDPSLARDGTVMRVGDDSIVGYFAANPGGVPNSDAPPAPIAIERFGSTDGRSFSFMSSVVLTPSSAWEGETVGAPAALQVASETWLFYAGKGGIGLAKSPDGHKFTRASEEPVLAPDASGWERGATPRSPGAVRLASGELRLFYEIEDAEHGSSIGEARSTDGVHFERIGSGPVLSPATSGFDAASVGAPSPSLATLATGRAITRVYYTARDRTGVTTIGLAARFGDDGVLQRAESPVFGTGSPYDPHGPSVVSFDGYELLFATQYASSVDLHPVVACGVAPATFVLSSLVPATSSSSTTP